MKNLASKTFILIGILFNFAHGLPGNAVELEQAAQLEEYFNKAQDAYFNEADSSQAISEFEKVASLANAASWSRSQKKLIHFSMLRIAQLSKEEDKIKHWLDVGYNFAPELKPDADLFPPPLIEQYAALNSPPSPKQYVKAEPLPNKELLLSPAQASDLDATATLPEPLEITMQNDKPLWKNKWLWVGIGTLAAGYIIYENQRNEPQQSPPQTTYGF